MQLPDDVIATCTVAVVLGGVSYGLVFQSSSLLKIN